MPAIFGLGQMELLILLGLGCSCVVPIVVVVAVLVAVRAGTKPAGGNCPHCGAATSDQADFCEKCGKPLR